MQMIAYLTLAQRLKRKFDHLSLSTLTTSRSSLRSSPTILVHHNFLNSCEYKSFCCGALNSSLFVEIRNVQKCIRLISSFSFDLFKIQHGIPAFGFPDNLEGSRGYCSLHTTSPPRTTGQNAIENKSMITAVSDAANDTSKPKRQKLKGRRAVVKWLKFFRWKKKKENERMTAEEKTLFKLKKARKKEERLIEALKKIEPKEMSVVLHDPEILTPEEHFYLLKMGHKCKNYVPVGRRGIFQGVILNMHLHWKKHQTLKVIVKTFTPKEVREIATELARLSGGIVLEISEDRTIIMYRGKNYLQPPTEIMSPKVTLTRKKALDKSKYRNALNAVRKYIPKLEQDLTDMQVGLKDAEDQKPELAHREEIPVAETKSKIPEHDREDGSESSMEYGMISESENLSDIFETDSDTTAMEKDSRPLYLDEFERFHSEDDVTTEDFQEYLRRISASTKRGDFEEKDLNVAGLDEIDKIFLRAGSLLKKKR